MKIMRMLTVLFVALLAFACTPDSSERPRQQAHEETKEQRDKRMHWWREARFGMFIHWGLYAVPAGEWKGQTNHAEWIRETAQIPLAEYEKFLPQFNPVEFNAGAWARMAREAGMKYIVITSKHHDGFCLFDSKETDFDVMATPFQRDILRELSEACQKEGITLCWYHSIMDWHHPDYLPRRTWEEKDRPAEGAVFDRYVEGYLKPQLRELTSNYGKIGVLWFDGEWETTWNETRGKDLYAYVRSLQGDIIINNRVSSGRSGMAGLTTEGAFSGDFGTPEQQVPATGLPGVDWESCITMNDHWGYNKNDKNWKSPRELIQMLADIASKGGNLLLNIGPTAEGVFPEESVERLKTLGAWMKTNGEAIYGTSASPFKQLSWGRCTQKAIDGGTRLYLHVFNWPANRKLVVPGIYNEVKQGYLLADAGKPLTVKRHEDALIIDVAAKPPTPFNSVVVLDLVGRADVNDPPEIKAVTDILVDSLEVTVASSRSQVEIRYTIDGTEPAMTSPLAQETLLLTGTTTVRARCFRDGKPVSGVAEKKFSRVTPRPAEQGVTTTAGVKYAYYEGEWKNLPDFKALKPTREGVVPGFALSPKAGDDKFGFEYTGFINVPARGVYTFYTESDDGSRLYIGDNLVVDNDGLHGMEEKKGVAPLEAGLHPIRVQFFENSGGDGLKVSYEGPGIRKEEMPQSIIFH